METRRELMALRKEFGSTPALPGTPRDAGADVRRLISNSELHTPN